jgi:hypothetical protein
MADTGENRQISARANAKEAETVRASQKVISKEHSTEQANDAAFDGTKLGPRLVAKKTKKPARP